MGNSTFKLQDCIDDARSIGDLTPIFEHGGFTVDPALRIANEVMKDIIIQRFNWKWNRIRLAPFYTNSWQQDYPQLGVANLGWLEHAYIIDINNTSIPKPLFWLRAVKDLERSSQVTAKPSLICWHYNGQLDEAAENAWPGALVNIINPLGQVAQPSNPKLCWYDKNGNLLVLTTYGQTGAGPAPFAPANSAEGVTVNDGSVVWTVVDPRSQGYRIAGVPSQTGVVYKVNPVGQAKPILFTTLQQFLDPIPDDFHTYFYEGFKAKLYDRSPMPNVRAKAETKQAEWKLSLNSAIGQGDREPDSFGIVPVRGIMDSDIPAEPGPAWPWGQLGR